MKTFGVGTKLFCDFHFGGKPKAICLEVIKAGDGKSGEGRIKVQLTETRGAYKKGEKMTLSSAYAVPCEMILPKKKGEFFTRLSTCYNWK
jgi:hypothetical protein